MTRLSLILLLSTCLAPPVLALEGLADPQETEQTQVNELSSELDDFVRSAISEGLLTPAGTADAEAEAVETEEPSTALKPRPVDMPAPPAVVDCSAPYPLDFAEFREFDRYQQIYNLREDASSATGKAAVDATFTLARAYLSLGLYSESDMQLKSETGPRAAAYRKMAALMEHRGAADIDYFRKLAACDDAAGIWLAAALLANDQDEGVGQLEDHLSEFRKLPFRLRADIVALVVPELDKRNEKILSVKLIADFTEEEIGNATQLQFAKSIVELGQNRPDAEKTVRTFLNQPQFQEDALAALMRHEKPLNGVYEEILLGELMKKFGQSGDDRALAASLQFALQELSGSSHYQPIMDLAGMPALQNDEAQTEIRRQLVAGLSRDLGSDNRLRNLAAMNALVSDPGILDAAPERSELYHSGASLAVRFGLASLAMELMRRDGADTNVVAQLADLEFLREDYAAVETWARTYPDNSHLTLLAAQSAIREGDTASLREFEGRVPLDPDTILTLIEQDAAIGRWIVSETIYDAARELTDARQKQRAERVFAMRKAARELAAGPKKLAMSGVATVLKRSDTSPEQVTGGAH